MKKVGIVLFTFLVFFSCKKDSTFPEEYNYLIGKWELDNYIDITYYLDNHPFSPVRDTFPAESLGYNISFQFTKDGFSQYIENTLVEQSERIESIRINKSVDSSSVIKIGYSIIYKRKYNLFHLKYSYGLYLLFNFNDDCLSTSYNIGEYGNQVRDLNFKRK